MSLAKQLYSFKYYKCGFTCEIKDILTFTLVEVSSRRGQMGRHPYLPHNLYISSPGVNHPLGVNQHLRVVP